MPKTAIDYSKCVIYKICCKDPSVTYEYYGHTTNKINRKREHKYSCNNENSKNYNLKVYQVIRENNGWDNWDFIIIEDYPCQNVDEARLRERYWIELKQPQLNFQIPSRTCEEWYNDNRNELLEKNKKYNKRNREKILEYQKKYYEDNKQKILEKQKKYYEENEERISQKIICECGSKIRSSEMSRHRKTQKHINYLNQINNQIQANENDGT